MIKAADWQFVQIVDAIQNLLGVQVHPVLRQP